MSNFTIEQIELINGAPNDYIREIYRKICSDNGIGEHYCYLERNLIEHLLEQSINKLSKIMEKLN